MMPGAMPPSNTVAAPNTPSAKAPLTTEPQLTSLNAVNPFADIHIAAPSAPIAAAPIMMPPVIFPSSLAEIANTPSAAAPLIKLPQLTSLNVLKPTADIVTAAPSIVIAAAPFIIDVVAFPISLAMPIRPSKATVPLNIPSQLTSLNVLNPRADINSAAPNNAIVPAPLIVLVLPNFSSIFPNFSIPPPTTSAALSAALPATEVAASTAVPPLVNKPFIPPFGNRPPIMPVRLRRPGPTVRARAEAIRPNCISKRPIIPM